MSPSSAPPVIVSALGLSPTSKRVASEAHALAQSLGGSARYVHVGDDTPEVRAQLAKVLESVIPGGSVGDVSIRAGDPSEVLSAEAASINADLVVAGALEREGLLTSLIGSVARRLVRRAPCPVMLLPVGLAETAPFKTLVASVESDTASAHMLDLVARIARSMGGKSLHVVREPDAAERTALRYATLAERDAANRRSREELSDFVSGRDVTGLRVHVNYLGDAMDGVGGVEYAQRVGADLLAFPAPSRPLTFWDRLFSHPTERVLDRLPCRLLVYRDKASLQPEAAGA
jgi:nucleotide-binding universal stress UspA family protein